MFSFEREREREREKFVLSNHRLHELYPDFFLSIYVCVQATNMFWPQWKKGEHKIEKKILMPELVIKIP